MEVFFDEETGGNRPGSNKPVCDTEYFFSINPLGEHLVLGLLVLALNCTNHFYETTDISVKG